ncbi:MAG TPA: IS66 family transposase [Solirubrobacteraceae bacterium]|jgi:transposase
MGEEGVVAADWRDERIAELEAEVARKDARIVELEGQVATLTAQVAALTKLVAELMEKLGRNSRNSHLPPSSDPPGKRGQGGQGKDKQGTRKRGGQPGHGGSRRTLLPPDEVDEVVDVFPPHCEGCARELPEVVDPDAHRYQQVEMPPITPHTTEWRCHEVACAKCGRKTRAPYDKEKIPASPFGPRLMALIAFLTGAYHVSRRKTVVLLWELLGVRISLGALSAVEARVSDAIAPAVEDAWKRVGAGAVKHTDGTSWLQAGAVRALWTIATKAATVFKILADNSKATLEPLYGSLRGILVSDRAKALGFWAMDRRQICWAHLLRKFVSFSERTGPAAAIGRELLDYTGILFEYWHDYRAGKLPRAVFVAWMAALGPKVEAVLTRAAAAGIDGLSGSCVDMLEHRQALWTFVEHDGVEPTNNHAEREIRAFVLWRKRSFGAQSDRGNVFAERVMTVAHTARKQDKNLLAFLTACCRARCGGSKLPSLFAADVAVAA